MIEEKKMESFEKRKNNQNLRKFQKQVKSQQRENKEKSIRDHINAVEEWKTSSNKNEGDLETILKEELKKKKGGKRNREEFSSQNDTSNHKLSKKRRMKNEKYGYSGMPNQLRKRLDNADMLKKRHNKSHLKNGQNQGKNKRVKAKRPGKQSRMRGRNKN